IFAQFCFLPGAAAVGRKKHMTDAVASIESNSFEFHRPAGLDLLALLVAGDKGPDGVAGDWNGPARFPSRFYAGAIVVRNAVSGVHPEAVELMINDFNLMEVLDPIGAVIAGNDQAQWIAVEPWEILAVH